MNHIFGRKQFEPREIGQLRTEFAPPDSPEQAVERLQRAIKDMPEPESEVMPPVPAGQRQPDGSDDTWPPSATGADRINPLDDIARLLRSLTYGEMMELAAAIWKAKSEGELDEKTLPATLHRWSGEHGKN